MDVDFELLLVILVALTGIAWIYEILIWKPRHRTVTTKPWQLEWTSSFFIPLLIVLLIRSFWIEPFRIPSGSLKPTLLDGDFIAVNKYAYGLRLPVINTKVVDIGEPHRGDILVFHWPPQPSIDYIKRVIGVPGDHIKYINKVLYINGQAQTQTDVGTTTDTNGGTGWQVIEKTENLQGIKHNIYINPQIPAFDIQDFVVPAGNYFVMGDNRDNSEDSRFWGFVPERDIVGKAFLIWFSWNSDPAGIRWNRIGNSIH